MNKGCLHAIAHCRNCNWFEEDYNTAKKKAREHSIKFNHIVDVETGNWYVFGEKKKRKKGE